jgi:hypothetical protein
MPYYPQSPASGWVGIRSHWTDRVPNFQLGHDWRTFMRGAPMSFGMMEWWNKGAVGTYGPYGRQVRQLNPRAVEFKPEAQHVRR